MPSTITAAFDTRREAEMAVERLVQEFGIERTDVFVAPEGQENSSGEEAAGSEAQAGSPSPEERDDAALTGRIVVSVDLQDDGKVEDVRSAFREFGGAQSAGK